MGKRKLPKILVTGASGTIGRNIIEDLCEYYYIYALARRTQQDAGVLAHKNIEWILVDIARESSLTTVIETSKTKGELILSSIWRRITTSAMSLIRNMSVPMSRVPA